MWAFGDNSVGQLGDGTKTARSIPVEVRSLDEVATLSAGYQHTVALKTDGTVWTWGANTKGQLGDNTTVNRSTPVEVNGLGGVIEVAAGYQHTAVLTGEGTVYTWGANTFGQLGDGGNIQQAAPVPVSDIKGAIALAAGNMHTVVLKNDGTVWAWGQNKDGQLGDGTTIQRSVPTQVKNLKGIVAIKAGSYHTVALKDDGTVWSFGDNQFGQLGDGSSTDRTTPVQIHSASGARILSAGYSHTAVVKNDGNLWVWGNNTYGQLGDGTTTNHMTPARVDGDLDGVIAVATGTGHTIALKEDGSVWAFGDNEDGRLGDGNAPNDSATPVYVMNLFQDGYAVTVHVDGGENGTVSDESLTVADGEVGILTITPNEGYMAIATGCGGQLVGTQYTTAPVKASCDIDVTFDVAPSYSVIIKKSGTGSGTMAGAGDYLVGSVVGLTAKAGTGSIFKGWSHSPCANVFTMPPRNLTCIARFEGGTVKATAVAGPNGTISPLVRTVAMGSKTTFTVRPNIGYMAVVTGCSGKLVGGIYTTAALQKPCAISATFKPVTYRVTVLKAGTGTGTASGGKAYAAKATVTLTATAATGSVFKGWSPAPCAARFTMPAKALTCTAVFDVVADTTPPVVDANQVFEYTENRVDIGEVLGTVAATDDVGVTGFAITTGNEKKLFAISATGDITFTAAGLASAANDFEGGLTGVTLTIVAKDAAGNKSTATRVSLDILDDASDNQTTGPVIDPGQLFSYMEGMAAGDVIGTVIANSDIGVTSFWIESGDDNSYFSIDDSGNISLTEAGAGSEANMAGSSFTLFIAAGDADGNQGSSVPVTLEVLGEEM